MIYLILGIGFKGLQTFLAKMAVGYGHYVYVTAGAAVSWNVLLFSYAFSQLSEHPYDLKWPQGYIFIFAVGIVAALASLFAYRSLSLLPVSVVALGMASAPLITVLCAHLVLQERLYREQWLGGILILLGVGLLVYSQNSGS